ncbi:hypothetical protein BD309DRAFT_909405 [Dichomitus squalens]|uniref:RBR-type E3 ubiquitin transferase n=1 Tax=Dichomitus squalens TaxID=114155 RepID=A0A4Q9N779_9APHY|nr:uncharacterized protein DICSQDRAFT_150991 [Dichomitus squalens LYAD-421 SS1]EJF66506.1 hypothetical protein DICSQDRAFT_150991 [Dichomitus squalens LYAD-421 SS1]TBU35031.1 hypothetical protein BD311DRAFT_783748 [Dichomitus squalens]TBU49737.1 hypothetical protein BD309DRAFT_909405 [Dichomitus squalens]TBU64847.1 hypothetical protein BD310DRAFT_913510 [Dichomitus squalens]
MSTEPDKYDLQGCAQLQQEEWEILESIHPDCLSRDSSSGFIRLEVPVELAESTCVTIQTGQVDPESSYHPGPSCPKALSLASLPPILLDISLPPTYPYTPPQIQTIRATYSWLRFDDSELRDYLGRKWEKGEGVLYTWVECIRSGQFLDELQLTQAENGRRTIRIHHPMPGLIKPVLESYNASTQAARFSQNSYECEVCLTSIKGARCVMLLCGHVFCRSCLEDFWKLCIKEGDVGRVGCPDPGCVKEQREANEEEVRRVVTEEEVLRWKWLRAKRAVEKDPTVVHCPMAQCQTPVPRAPNVEEGSPYERLRTCPECGFSFCAYCKHAWHGPVATCPISATKAILTEYMALPEGSAERKQLETLYGRVALQKLVDQYEHEKKFREWLAQRMGTPCPGCDLPVEKASGCNHMTCVRCQQHYCYRCGAKLDKIHPYKHFSTPGIRCFQRLFDEHIDIDEWQPVEGFNVI